MRDTNELFMYCLLFCIVVWPGHPAVLLLSIFLHITRDTLAKSHVYPTISMSTSSHISCCVISFTPKQISSRHSGRLERQNQIVWTCWTNGWRKVNKEREWARRGWLGQGREDIFTKYRGEGEALIKAAKVWGSRREVKQTRKHKYSRTAFKSFYGEEKDSGLLIVKPSLTLPQTLLTCKLRTPFTVAV